MTQLAGYTAGAFTTSTGIAVAAGAAIEVRRVSDGAFASIFSDEAGTTGITQPGFTADSQGHFQFYVAGLLRGYTVKVTSGADTFTALANIGTAGQVDATAFGASRIVVADAAGARSLDSTYSQVETDSRVANKARQTVSVGLLDANGDPNFLQAGTGLRLKVMATSVALTLTSANGFSADVNETIAADVADITGADLSASNTTYAYRTIGSAWGTTLVPPDYAKVFDRTRGALLNFEGTNAATTTTDDFGNTWTANGNAQIATAQFKFGSSSTVLDGTGDFWSCTNITTLGDGSWEASLWFRINALPASAARAGLISFENASNFGVLLALFNNAGTTKLELSLSSNGTSADIASGTVGTNTTWTLAQWNKVRIVFDALAGNYKVYLSLNAAAESADISVTSSLKICPITQSRIGRTGTANDFNGWIDAFRFVRCATATGTQTPSASAPAIGNFPYHWFSRQEMKMYEVTSASATAGTNPGMTQRQRVFLGEGDTNASAVTAVRNYALKGEYQSAFATPLPGVSTQTSFNHNIGVRPERMELELENRIPEQGFTLGDRLQRPLSSNASWASQIHLTASGRNAMSFSTQATTAFEATAPKTGGGAVVLTAANWAYRVMASRGW